VFVSILSGTLVHAAEPLVLESKIRWEM